MGWLLFAWSIRSTTHTLLIGERFSSFCFLANRENAVPDGWDWQHFLKSAPLYIAYAFGKSDAKERWGSENYFNAEMGGRSLRFTGNIIYGSPVDTPTKSIQHVEALERVASNESNVEEMQQQVGGIEAWKKLVLGLEQSQRFL